MVPQLLGVADAVSGPGKRRRLEVEVTEEGVVELFIKYNKLSRWAGLSGRWAGLVGRWAGLLGRWAGLLMTIYTLQQ